MHPCKIVALTGGTGFIGTHLLKHLILNDYQVRVLARSPSKLAFNHPHIEVVSGSLHDHSALTELTHKVDAVIHCAGRIKGISAQQFILDNVQGTKNLIASYQNAVLEQKFILVSSLAARHPTLSDYALSKQLSEAELQSSALKNWLIIRPPAVYGANDKELKPLFDWMKRGILFIPGKTNKRFSIIHVDDLSRLVLNQLEPNTFEHQIIEPDDGKFEGYSWDEIRIHAEDYFRRDIKPINLSPLFLNTCAKINLGIARIFNNSPMLTPSKVRELLHNNWIVDNQHDVSTWSPTIDLKTGLSTLYSS